MSSPPNTRSPWSPADLRRLLSADRFDRYVRAAASREAAVDLYVWNARLGGALHEALGMFEVVLRNAIERQLTAYDRLALGGDGRWYADKRMPWRSARAVADIARARAEATRRGSIPELQGKVVAELTFGFWRYLLAARYQATLWAPALRRAFPGLRSQKREAVYGPVDRLHSLRNRIAHHEPIHGFNVAARHEELLTVAGWIDPAAAAWIGEVSRVPAVVNDRP